MKAPTGQRCRATFIQKENVALALNSLTMLFKVSPPATCPISAITLFGFSGWIIAIIWVASHIFHNELWLPVFICLLFSLEILTCLQSEHYVSVTRCRIAPFLLGGHLLFSPLLHAFGMNRRLRVCSCSCDSAWCSGSQTRHVWEHWLPAQQTSFCAVLAQHSVQVSRYSPQNKLPRFTGGFGLENSVALVWRITEQTPPPKCTIRKA